jgi:hypothetical protein
MTIKKTLQITLLVFCSYFSQRFVSADISFQNFQVQPIDTSKVELFGIVRDADTKDPIIFAHVILTGTNIGTVTNMDGKFLLKIPASAINGQITVSSLGYKNLTLAINELERIRNEIELEMVRYPIKEVVIRRVTAPDLIRLAMKKIPENYGETPAMLTAFYRETIKQNRNYVAISEAVFDVYKGPYTKFSDEDRIKVFKGRKSQDVSRMDTVLFKLQGGPYNLFVLDVAKHFDLLFGPEYFDYYDFWFEGEVNVQDRESYVIGFNQKHDVKLPLYAGKVYIDVQTVAISSIEFSLSSFGIEYAPAMMILKKPVGMKVEIPEANYLVKYRYSDGRWYLSYSRSDAAFRCKWNRKLFRSTYSTMSEMAITDVDLSNIVKFRVRETTTSSDIFSEIVSDFEDPEFWGDYNIIRPEISIEEATKRLYRRLQRR